MGEVTSFEKVPVFTLAVRPSVLTVLHLSSSLLLLDVEEMLYPLSYSRTHFPPAQT